MENLETKSPPKSTNTGYVPLKDFQDHMKKGMSSPYHSRFSFAVLIKELHAKTEALQHNTLSETIASLEKIEAQLQEDSQRWESLLQQGELQSLLVHVFPSFFFEGQLGFIKGPFESNQFRFTTQSFMDILAEDRWEIKVSGHKLMATDSQDILMAGTSILNKFYQQESDIYSGEGMTLRDRDTKMERHYKFNMTLDYMDIKAVKPLKKLSKKQIHELLSNLYNSELWLKYIPPENFLFEGLVIGFISDNTKTETLSTVKEMMANEGGRSDHENDLNYLELLARSYLNMPDLSLGTLQIVNGPWMESLSWSLLRRYDKALVNESLEDLKSAYGKLMHEGQAQIVEDLQKQEQLSPIEKKLLEKGYRSLLLAPLKDGDGKTISIFELAAPEPYRFNQLTLVQLREYISLFEMGSNKFIQEMNNSVRLTIQQEFTSIHPSVEWKFRDAASKYFWERTVEQQQSSMDPIVFKEVYPLYGQADIVSSSKQRNHSIKTDLMDNLERLHSVLIACRKALNFHLLDIWAQKVLTNLERFKKGDFVSSDESLIVELLTEQIHPLIRNLMTRFPQLPQDLLDEYFNYLDPELDIVYRYRKDYEDSVSLINQTISHYLLQEEQKMQEILPHYFEKFQTDGVEYNLYLGQSLLSEGEFHSFYLHDFRLWQLILMCEITRLVERESKNFPVPLTTAQLIFVYNSSLSIRFTMDEKQFDVDGAYNVRYEILKKRIDKAYIKGTEDRLTKAGMIAIVLLQEKDRQEYQEYVDHLVRNGYVSPQIEDLDLEKMQGVEGLKAVRLKVLVD